MKRFAGVAVACCVALGVAACGSSSSGSDSGSSSTGGAKKLSGPIKIGVIGGETGAYAFVGQEQKKAVALAVDDINKAGGVLGAKLSFSAYDDGGDSNRAISAFQKIASDGKTVALIGSGDAGQATAGYAERLKMPDLGIVDGGGPTIYPKGIGTEPLKWVFEFTPSNYSFGGKLAEYAAANCKKTALLHDTTTYGKGAEEAIKAGLQKAGKSLAIDDPITEDWSSTTSAAVTPEVLKLKNAGIDCVIGWLTPADDARFELTAQANGYKPTFMGNDTTPATPDYTKIAKKAADGTVAANLKGLLHPTDKYTQFAAAYKARFGSDPSVFAVQSYDTVATLVDAIKRAGSTDRDKVRDALESTNLQGVGDQIEFTDQVHESVTPEDLEIIKYDYASNTWKPTGQ